MPPLSCAASRAATSTVQSMGEITCGPCPAARFNRLSAEVLRKRLNSTSTLAKKSSAHRIPARIIGVRSGSVDQTQTPTSVFIARN